MTAMAGLTYQVGLLFATHTALLTTVLTIFKWQVFFILFFWLQLVETLQWRGSFLGPLEVQQ